MAVGPHNRSLNRSDGWARNLKSTLLPPPG